MFEEQRRRIGDYKKSHKILNVVWVAVKVCIASAVIAYIDYGAYFVIGYILYALEKASGLQFINAQEVDLQLNIMHHKINELEKNVG